MVHHLPSIIRPWRVWLVCSSTLSDYIRIVVRGSSVAWVVVVSFNNRMVSFNCDNIGFGLVWYVQSSNLVASHPRVVVFGG